MASALSKIAAATPTKGGINIRDGRYRYLVEKITYDEKSRSGAAYIVEFRVIKSESNGDTDEKRQGEVGKPTVPNPVGSSCSMVSLIDKFDSAAGNVKAFLMAAMAPLGYLEEHITEAVLLEVADARNPLRGLQVDNDTRRTWNQGKNTPANRGLAMTSNGWKPVIPQTLEDIAKNRAWLDANPNGAPGDAASSAPAAPVADAPAAPAPVAPPAPPAPSTPLRSPLLAGLTGMSARA